MTFPGPRCGGRPSGHGGATAAARTLSAILLAAFLGWFGANGRAVTLIQSPDPAPSPSPDSPGRQPQHLHRQPIALPKIASASTPDRPSDTLIVTAADDGRSLSLRRGETLLVVLADTAGTGYSWEIERYSRPLLQPLGRQTWQDPGPPPPPGFKGPVGLVGGPLQVSFRFRAVASGSAELRLRHWRPWEGPGSVDRRFRLQVRIVD